MSRCEDCGCGLSYWVCTNCHEEYYIQNYQTEYTDPPFSKEFIDKANESAKILSNKT